MHLFTEKEQPYGLLSNFAATPFNVEGTWWQTVNEYIFVNMLSDSTMKERMRRELQRTVEPAIVFEEMENEIWRRKFIEGLKVVLNSVINSRRDLQKMLIVSNGVSFKDEDELEDFLNEKRDELLDRKEVIPVHRAKRIIEGVTRALRAGKNINPRKTISELKEFEIAVSSSISEDDEALNHSNDIIPYLNFKLETEQETQAYIQKLDSFKNLVFDKYLDNKLRVDYPGLPLEDYATAKAQQFEGLDKFERSNMINSVYDLYLEGKLAQEILQTVGDAPSVNPNLAYVPPWGGELRIKSNSHPLSPYGMGQVVVDNMLFRSAIHYAYWQMFNTLGAPQRPDLDRFRKEDLKGLFEIHHRNDMKIKLKDFADTAIRTKLEKYPVLTHLLKTTGDDPILWADYSDPVLGIGRDGKGDNGVGEILMNYRERLNPRDRRISEDYLSPMANIFLKEWVFMRLTDIHNSMGTMINPTSEDLQDLYRFPQSNSENVFQGLDPADRRILGMALPEITDDVLKTAWPLVYPQMYVLKRLTDINLVNVIVKAQNLYMGKVPSNDEKHAVRMYLQEYFARHEKNMKLNNSAAFSGRILSGWKFNNVHSLHDIFSEALNPRVFYWFDIAKKLKTHM